MKTFIEIHALQNFAPSNLNRDDTGAPKDAFFGGTRRARISSQCLKRAIRTHFHGLVKEGAISTDSMADRTKRVLDEITKGLSAAGRSDDAIRNKVVAVFASVGLTIKDDGKTEYLLFIGHREIQKIVQLINEKWDAISLAEKTSDGEKAGKAKKDAGKKGDPEIKKTMEAILDGGKAIDIALFGRMLADMPEKNQDGSCQVAHAISTHRVEREFDYYTAVDDLKPEDTSGADMIGTVEFNSACFYRYAVIDWEKLVTNLQGDKELASKGLNAFLEGFVVAEPTGKQNAFAAHNPPEFVAVSVRHGAAPCSYANAFETAVRVDKDASLTKESASRLIAKAKTLRTAFGGVGRTYVLNLVGADIAGFGESVASLGDLLAKAQSSL